MLAALRSIFGDTDVSEPQETIVKRWKQDPFARGSYSNYPVNSSEIYRKDLASSIDGKLFFAGEATHIDYWGTTHGAFLSGVDAASDVINKLRNTRKLRGSKKYVQSHGEERSRTSSVGRDEYRPTEFTPRKLSENKK